MGQVSVNSVDLHSGIFFSVYNAGSPVSPDGAGLLTVNFGEGSIIRVTGGSTVRGIRLVQNASRITVASDQRFMLMLESSSGVPVTIIHEDVTLDAEDRISVNDGADTAIDQKTVQVFYDGATNRWLIFDWAGV